MNSDREPHRATINETLYKQHSPTTKKFIFAWLLSQKSRMKGQSFPLANLEHDYVCMLARMSKLVGKQSFYLHTVPNEGLPIMRLFTFLHKYNYKQLLLAKQ